MAIVVYVRGAGRGQKKTQGILREQNKQGKYETHQYVLNYRDSIMLKLVVVRV